MLKVIDLLRLPSLSEAFIAAGAEGMFKIIRKLEVLEEAYPSVVRFLRPNEFYLTNFWSLVDKKEGRIRSYDVDSAGCYENSDFQYSPAVYQGACG